MEQQTAVEWLMETLEKNNIVDLDTVSSDEYYSVIEQAKQMEKEQIIDSYIMGSYDMAAKEFRPEQYYKETYSGQI